MQTLSIFISSPGDVGREREIARKVINRVEAAFVRRIKLVPFFWEHEVMRATADFQSQIRPPASFDVFICVLWSRLGSRLGAQHQRPDGTFYASGTEYEFENALTAYLASEQAPKTPELLVYRRTEPPTLPIEPDDLVEERRAQWKALQGFVKKWFQASDGTFKGAFNSYRDLAEFEANLEEHLRKVVAERLRTEAWKSEPAAALPTPAVWTQGSPYRGLRVFEFEHEAVFFGRTRAVDDVLGALRRRAALERCPFVLIFGASGAGKSSLLRAGVLPLLTRPGVVEGVGLWRWFALKPSSAAGDLFDGLAAALLERDALPELAADGTTEEQLAGLLRANPEGVSLLIKEALSRAAREVQLQERLEAQPKARLAVGLDQLEEVFTLADRFDAAMRENWFCSVAALARSGFVWVIATMRSDFYQRCEESSDLVTLKTGDGSYHLLAPTPAEFGQIIRLPAQAAGAVFEDDKAKGRLDETIRDAALRDPASLPLVEYALDELYRRQEDGVLTFLAYEELGGVEGALAQRAEQIFSALAPEAQQALDDLFRRLITLGTGADAPPTRQWAQVDEGNARPPVGALLERFVEERLITSDRAQDGRAVVSITHEALLHAWPRLSRWIAENREFLRAKGRLARAAREWEAQGRAADYLLAEGKPLSEAKEVVEMFPEALDPVERELVQRSKKRAEAAATRRVRTVSAIAAVLALLLVGAIGFWIKSEANAREAARARAGADDLVNHMLTDLHEQLKGSGNVRLLASSLEKVRAHYAEHGSAMPPARRIQLHTAEGEILKSLARGPEAAAAFEHAIQTAGDASGKSPRDLELRALKAAALNRLSDLLAASDLRKGLAVAEQGIELFRTLDPSAPHLRADLAEALMNRADLQRRLDMRDAALRTYGESRALLPAETLRDTRETTVLAHVLLRLADLQIDQRLTEEGSASFADLERLLRRATHEAPRNFTLKDLLATALDHLAEAALRRKDLGEARTLSEQAVANRRALVAQDPSNQEWRRGLAISIRRLADILRRAADDAALALAEEAVRLSGDLVQIDPENVELQRDLANASELHIRMLFDRDQIDRALPLAKKLVEQRNALVRARDNASSRIELADAFVLYTALLGGLPGDHQSMIGEARKNTDELAKNPQASPLVVARLYYDLADAIAGLSERGSEVASLFRKAQEVASSIAGFEAEKSELTEKIENALAEAEKPR